VPLVAKHGDGLSVGVLGLEEQDPSQFG
jgi:hypothetical protein